MFSAFAAAPASAADWNMHSQTVGYADLDLTSEAGAQTMIGRIERAARNVCFSQAGPMPLMSRRAQRACRTTTMTNAVDMLGAPMVTAMYYGHEPMIVIASR